MTSEETLYTSIKQLRQSASQPYYRILLSGYLNDDEVKKQSINPQKYLKSTVSAHLKNITGYLYIKGLFYLHLIESKNIKLINKYLQEFYNLTLKQPNVHNQIRIVYQSYQCPSQFFRGWQCEYVQQPGPILIQTDKTEQQIADRSFQIYENLEDGAKRKKQNNSYKLANMFLLSNDDMSILISKYFMSLNQYAEIYLSHQEMSKQCENNYPQPPNIFNVMEFMEIQDYTQYK